MRRQILTCAMAAAPLLPSAVWAKLDAEEIEIKVSVQARSSEMVSTLESWVEINTGTWNLEGLERQAELLAQPLRELGFEVELEEGREVELPGHEGRRTGPLIVGRRAARTGQDKAPHFLLVGHYDTVFEEESEFQEFAVSDEDLGRAFGPGVADMKGGLVVMIAALRALEESGDLARAAWTVLMNADEEIGSLISRERIETTARDATFGFVFEAGLPDGSMVSSRRGLGQFHLRVTGVGAHAGNAHSRGRSAVRELAQKVVLIEEMTDYEKGLTLNVGTFHGGTKRNVVPDSAEAWIDLRYDEPELGEEVRAKLQQLADQVLVEGTTSKLWGTLHRPPKRPTPETLRLLSLFNAVSSDLGVEAGEPVHAGGGTDGSLTSAVGLPTLDSMGVRGGNAHTVEEFVILDSLTERAAIAAILLRRLIRMDPAALRAPAEAVE